MILILNGEFFYMYENSQKNYLSWSTKINVVDKWPVWIKTTLYLSRMY